MAGTATARRLVPSDPAGGNDRWRSAVAHRPSATPWRSRRRRIACPHPRRTRRRLP